MKIKPLTILILLFSSNGLWLNASSCHESDWFYDQSTVQAFYMFEAITIDGEPVVGDGMPCWQSQCSVFNSCDMVGAFFNDVLVGWVYADSEGMTTLAVMGNDNLNSFPDYPEAGDIIQFKIFDHNQGTILDLYTPVEPQPFENYGVFLIAGTTIALNDANPGCTDPEAMNYDPEANIPDGSCLYNCGGCASVGCDEGYQCVDFGNSEFAEFCISSSCQCDEQGECWGTDDCNGGTCIPIDPQQGDICIYYYGSENLEYPGFVDCNNTCKYYSFLNRVGNGICNSNSTGGALHCPAFNCDGGDCGTELVDGVCTDEFLNVGDECIFASVEPGYRDCSLCCEPAWRFEEWLGDGIADCGWDCYVVYIGDFDCYELGYDCGDCNPDWDGTDPLGFCSDCCFPGDFNCDLSINVLDIVAIVNCILNGTDCPCGDFNGDGAVNVLDVVLVVNEILGE